MQAEWSPAAVAALPGNDDTDGVKPITVTAQQRKTIERAIKRVRKERDDPDLDEGKCVAIVCRAYLKK